MNIFDDSTWSEQNIIGLEYFQFSSRRSCFIFFFPLRLDHDSCSQFNNNISVCKPNEKKNKNADRISHFTFSQYLMVKERVSLLHKIEILWTIIAFVTIYSYGLESDRKSWIKSSIENDDVDGDDDRHHSIG